MEQANSAPTPLHLSLVAPRLTSLSHVLDACAKVYHFFFSYDIYFFLASLDWVCFVADLLLNIKSKIVSRKNIFVLSESTDADASICTCLKYYII